MTTKAHALMVKARSYLLMKHPFFGTLGLRLELIPTEDIDTAGVDGKHMFYNPGFVEKLTQFELHGLLAHEVLHCVYNHMGRKQFRDSNVWNIACDYVINTHLLACGFILPKGGLIDTEGKYKDMSAEAVYNLIKDECEKQGQKAPQWGQVLGPADGSSQGAMEAEWELATRAAAAQARKAGKLPGSFLGTIDTLLEPTVDWRSLLWPFATNLSNVDYSWARPNRAYVSEDEYLPSMRSETLGPIVVIIDTSGSVSDKALTQFWSEIVDIAETTLPSKLIVIQCDAKVQSVEDLEIEGLRDYKFQLKGRGGTDFAPAINKANEFEEIEAIVFLTDMECSSYGETPTCPVMWMSTEKKWSQPPFGEVIYMAIDE